MCQYCGCRAIETIGRLTQEHVEIRNTIGSIRRAATAGDPPAALVALQELAAILRAHDAVEELSVYPAMARREQYREKVDILFEEHDDVDAAIERALARAQEIGPETVDWEGLLTVLWTLSEHIEHEENGMFPAAAVELDPGEWEHAEWIRAEVEAGRL